MSAEFFRKIAAQRQQAKDERAAAREERDERHRKHAEFTTTWFKVYVPASESDSMEQYRQSILENLVTLGPLILERYWDFLLADLLVHPGADVDYKMAATLVLDASFGRTEEVLQCLINGESLLEGVSSIHHDLLEYLQQQASKDENGLPLTPPLRLTVLQQLLGHKKRDTISNWVRHGKLTSPDKKTKSQNSAQQPKARTPQPKRWRHVDQEIQKQLLLAIRDKMPEIIWRSEVGADE